MIRLPTASMLARGLLAASLAGTLLFFRPAIALAPAGHLAGTLVELTSPWLLHMHVQADGSTIRASGQIHLDMTLADGSPLPPTPGAWSRHGDQTLAIAIIALAVWAAAPAGKRRWLALPVALAAATFAAALVLAVDIQLAALDAIGYRWLPSFSFADLPANHAAFARLERAFRLALGSKIFHDAGGAWFYGLLAGWLGFALPGDRLSRLFPKLSPLHPRHHDLFS